MAYHALAAGEAEAAYRYSVQAGDEAMEVFAVDDAIGHYEQARALLQEHKPLQTELAAAEVEHLYAQLGRAYAFQNAWEKAQEAYEEMLAYARQKSLPALVRMTLNRLAVLALQQSNDKPKARAFLEEAWQIAQSSHDQRALAETEWNLPQTTATVWEDPKSALSHATRRRAGAGPSPEDTPPAYSHGLGEYLSSLAAVRRGAGSPRRGSIRGRDIRHRTIARACSFAAVHA